MHWNDFVSKQVNEPQNSTKSTCTNFEGSLAEALNRIERATKLQIRRNANRCSPWQRKMQDKIETKKQVERVSSKTSSGSFTQYSSCKIGNVSSVETIYYEGSLKNSNKSLLSLKTKPVTSSIILNTKKSTNVRKSYSYTKQALQKKLYKTQSEICISSSESYCTTKNETEVKKGVVSKYKFDFTFGSFATELSVLKECILSAPPPASRATDIYIDWKQASYKIPNPIRMIKNEVNSNILNSVIVNPNKQYLQKINETEHHKFETKVSEVGTKSSIYVDTWLDNICENSKVDCLKSNFQVDDTMFNENFRLKAKSHVSISENFILNRYLKTSTDRDYNTKYKDVNNLSLVSASFENNSYQSLQSCNSFSLKRQQFYKNSITSPTNCTKYLCKKQKDIKTKSSCFNCVLQ